MKKIILSAACLALLAVSCSKSSSTPEEKTKPEPTVLLTKVANSTQGDPDNGKTVAEFTYSGKQLLQGIVYSYSGQSTYKETHSFTYNTQGQLTGSTISHSIPNSYDHVNSTLTYTGSNIGKITFYKAGNVTSKEHTLTYDGTKLTRWFTPSEVDMAYTYDASGNNTKQVATEYSNNKATGYVYTDSYLTFDSKHNLASALPNWVYFRVNNEEEALGYATGSTNPLTANESGSNATYSYEYNSNGYPTKVTRVSSGVSRTYTYEYKVVE